MRSVITLTVAIAALTLASCASGADPTLAAPTTTPFSSTDAIDRQDRFWTAYEKRLGLVGTDYADPAEAKSGSIRYGYFLCGELTKGVDRNVLISQGSRGQYSREEFEAQLDTAVEFLCPEHG